ncbi:hypothetical protein NMG60_11034825 [Bertholletia excelsa]
MSQEQPSRTKTEQGAIKYGEVFNVSGELASKPITPQDAAAMQPVENMALGQTQRGRPAAVMQSAAAVNERRDAVGHRDATNIARDQGVSLTETNIGGRRIITESVGDQVLDQYTEPQRGERRPPAPITNPNALTIGEALEVAVLSAGNKPVDQSDAAAIQAAEVRATGSNEISPGGVASAALSAATRNMRVMLEENKTRLGDVLEDATGKLQSDKPATRDDAERVIGAELRNDPSMATFPGGVADSVAAAARLNTQFNR